MGLMKHYDSKGFLKDEEKAPAEVRRPAAPRAFAAPEPAPPDQAVQTHRLLHLLAEQLRNCAGDPVAVNSVVERLKRAADTLLDSTAVRS